MCFAWFNFEILVVDAEAWFACCPFPPLFHSLLSTQLVITIHTSLSLLSLPSCMFNEHSESNSANNTCFKENHKSFFVVGCTAQSCWAMHASIEVLTHMDAWFLAEQLSCYATHAGVEVVTRVMEAWSQHEGVQCNCCLAYMALVRGTGSICQVTTCSSLPLMFTVVCLGIYGPYQRHWPQLLKLCPSCCIELS